MEDKHLVFEGKCVGQILEFELLWREVMRKGRIRTVIVGMDNQAEMRAIGNLGAGTARYIVNKILKGICRV
ncbi:hypothetical protein J132_06964 [Termitomyces sp. J132]|nr:hypothetical protein J132_06964 [Termitomyces sp. J132]